MTRVHPSPSPRSGATRKPMSGTGRASRAARKRRAARRRPEPDKYALYERAVQLPEADVRFLDRVFRRHAGRTPQRLREDFCGTAAIACRWVASQPERRAWGVDIDPEPLAWGRAQHLPELGSDARKRIELVRGDVRTASHPKVDVTIAFNFSHYVFKTRDVMRAYFTKARSTLRRDGLFVIDAFGGSDAHKTIVETTRHDDFTYRWEQSYFDPISHDLRCHIHFELAGGPRMRRVFSYDWRLWTLPELKELLLEAGFRAVSVYWEGTDPRTNEGNGIFRLRKTAPDDPAWVSYLVAER